MSAQENPISLEENFERIEEILDRLSEEQVPLEEAFQAYKEGMDLLKKCNEQIDTVEKKVLVLSENGELEELERC